MIYYAINSLVNVIAMLHVNDTNFRDKFLQCINYLTLSKIKYIM